MQGLNEDYWALSREQPGNSPFEQALPFAEQERIAKERAKHKEMKRLLSYMGFGNTAVPSPFYWGRDMEDMMDIFTTFEFLYLNNDEKIKEPVVWEYLNFQYLGSIPKIEVKFHSQQPGFKLYTCIFISPK